MPVACPWAVGASDGLTQLLTGVLQAEHRCNYQRMRGAPCSCARASTAAAATYRRGGPRPHPYRPEASRLCAANPESCPREDVLSEGRRSCDDPQTCPPPPPPPPRAYECSVCWPQWQCCGYLQGLLEPISRCCTSRLPQAHPCLQEQSATCTAQAWPSTDSNASAAECRNCNCAHGPLSTQLTY